MKQVTEAGPRHAAIWLVLLLIVLGGCTPSAGQSDDDSSFPSRIDSLQTEEPAEHCILFEDPQIADDWFYVMPNVPEVELGFVFVGAIPGMGRGISLGPGMLEYTAVLGEVESDVCALEGTSQDRMSCLVSSFDQANFGQSQTVSVYVSGCPDSIYESEIELPAFDYDRCDFFDVFTMEAMVDQTSPNLEIYATRTGGIPGPSTWDLSGYPGFDQMPLLYSAYFDDVEASEVVERSSYPGRLYAVFDVPDVYLMTSREYRLYVNQCDSPIHSEWFQIYIPSPTPCQPPPGGCPPGFDWWQDQCICGAN
jgi:hypothetical protein